MQPAIAPVTLADLDVELDCARADNEALTKRLELLRPALQTLALELATARRERAALRAEHDRLLADTP